jgi:hypothetical protein
MADFCRACSLEHFDKDYEDLRGATTSDMQNKGKFAVVICEGCGCIQVDINGSCISEDCSLKGQPGHGIEPGEK